MSSLPPTSANLDSVGAYTLSEVCINPQREFPTDMGYFLLLDDTAERVQQLLHIADVQANNENACAKSIQPHAPKGDVSLARIDTVERLLFARQVWNRNYPTDLRICSEAAQKMADSDVSFVQLQAGLQAVADRLATDNNTTNRTARFLLSSVYAPLLVMWNADLINALLLQTILLTRGAISKEEYPIIVERVRQKVNEIILEN